ncbi:hypothetical protein ACFSR7_11800 [Cohnella sp. GCM10020058]|uniref:hypothetical protein n=1 Tax=Cohnella sp. GCM10020058 TaxID=3317330 RepID=UPI003628BA1A
MLKSGWKKTASTGAALMLATAVMAACSGNDKENAAASGGYAGAPSASGSASAAAPAPAKDAVSLKIMIPGDRPSDMDKVIAEAEKRMAEKGLNIKLDMTFVPWADFGQKSQVSLTAGESIDLIFDAP